MCGLLGSFSKNTQVSTPIHFKKALNTLSHRGPDLVTVTQFENSFLGFTRLSIVDVQGGSQPFTDKNSGISLICNGEIYNHRDLRKGLKKKYDFQSKSDCEIIIPLYCEDPDGFFDKLRGQFAFALFDSKKNKVILARDRFGIQPLFYAYKDNVFYVSSEIKALLALNPSISTRLDAIGLKETFYLYGPTPPRTCFAHVFQIPPGHRVVFDLMKNKIEVDSRFWNLPEKQISFPINKSDVVARFLLLFQNSVTKRLLGDQKKSAAYISGGLDSASVASIMQKIDPALQSFSVQFNDRQVDESKYQKMVSKHLDINLRSIIGDDDFDTFLPQIIWHSESPLIRTAPIGLYSLSMVVRSLGYKFVLCGEGADELLLGYPVFSKNQSSIEHKLAEHIKLEKLFLPTSHSGNQMVRDTESNIRKEFLLPKNDILLKQLVEIQTKLSRYLLVSQGDRMSMSHSVEQRFPFLDEDLMDLLFSLPSQWLFENGRDKDILKLAINKLLPVEILNRKKQGYIAPMAKALYASEFFSQVVNLKKREQFQSIASIYFNYPECLKLFEKFKQKSLTEVETIGLLLVVSTYILHKQFFQKL